MKALIVSDGKRGHENQALAFCRYVGVQCEVVRVEMSVPKWMTYLLDWFGIYLPQLFKPKIACGFDMVVSAGSATYYANKTIAKKCEAKSVALMEPKGFRKNFDLVFSQAHDGGTMPVNFAYAKPLGEIELGNEDVAVVIGGPNRVFDMEKEEIKRLLDFIFMHFKGKKAVTTSPRTPKQIERLVEEYGWDYKVIFSKEPKNPIGDFLQAGTIFVTMDSTSMISEAVSGGRARVEVVPLRAKKANKYEKMVRNLAKDGYVHIFDGRLGNAKKKVDFTFVKDEVAKLFE